VLEEENDLQNTKSKITEENRYLIAHPRVIVTPHLAFNTQEAVERILNTTIKNIRQFATGTPTNLIATTT